KTHTLPAAMTADDQQVSFTVSPTNGRIAYGCSVPADDSANSSSPVYAVWATDDAGATWGLRSDLPEPVTVSGYCSLEIASADSQSVLAVVQNSGVSQTYSYLSTDGGSSWVSFAPQTDVHTLIITSQIAYAVLSNPNGVCGVSAILDPAGHALPRLCSSVDGLKTWKPIDAALIAAKAYPDSLYYNPGDGSLLAQTYSDTGPLPLPIMYLSKDQGKTWQMSSPQGFMEIAVSSGGAEWRVCGSSYSSGGVNDLQCSDDGGQTWTEMAPLDVSTHCVPCSDNYSGWQVQQMDLEGVLPDGMVLAAARNWENSPSSVDISQDHAGFSLYRLTPKSSQWQSLGPLPFHDDVPIPLVYFTATGLLWHISDNQVATTTYQA
ncbi:MAG TPA: sialidase family protein, partial [Ktedonobacterales bacterium]|nr:sialidase family protein [Ktedonobacterales bacterium]